jgi:hypothetical protein
MTNKNFVRGADFFEFQRRIAFFLNRPNSLAFHPKFFGNPIDKGISLLYNADALPEGVLISNERKKERTS